MHQKDSTRFERISGQKRKRRKMSYCSKCGSKIAERDLYCSACGTRLEQVGATEEKAPVVSIEEPRVEE
jgi:uncharacterized OB-fold protein